MSSALWAPWTKLLMGEVMATEVGGNPRGHHLGRGPPARCTEKGLKPRGHAGQSPELELNPLPLMLLDDWKSPLCSTHTPF